jgi:hypothetical protein
MCFNSMAMRANISLQPTVIPLRGLPAAELRRWSPEAFFA